MRTQQTMAGMKDLLYFSISNTWVSEYDSAKMCNYSVGSLIFTHCPWRAGLLEMFHCIPYNNKAAELQL